MYTEPLDKKRHACQKLSREAEPATMNDDNENSADHVSASDENNAPKMAKKLESVTRVVSSAEDPLEGIASVRDSIFDRLVTGDGDVVGLLAYSLSKQNKRDWLVAFRKEKGRDPDSVELDAFDIGETIDRRIGTYRKLAEVALSGEAGWASSTVTPVSEMSVSPPTASAEQAVAPPQESSMASFSPAPKGKDGWFIKRR